MRWWLSLAAVLLMVSAVIAVAVMPFGPSPSSARTSDPPVPTAAAESPPIVAEPGPTPDGMVWIPGGTFIMGDRRGAAHKHPEHLAEIPEHNDSRLEHNVTLDGFWMDAAEVTNARFEEFVQATAFVTEAEKPISREL